MFGSYEIKSPIILTTWLVTRVLIHKYYLAPITLLYFTPQYIPNIPTISISHQGNVISTIKQGYGTLEIKSGQKGQSVNSLEVSFERGRSNESSFKRSFHLTRSRSNERHRTNIQLVRRQTVTSLEARSNELVRILTRCQFRAQNFPISFFSIFFTSNLI